LKNDEKLVSKALQINGNNLRYASNELKNNKNIVRKAVVQNGNSLQ
jgi:hypothetical protein